MSTIKVTKENYNSLVEENPTVLLDFYADWCGPCRMVGPVIEELSEERSDVVFGKINVDDEPQLASAFGIVSIPTLVIMKNGKPAEKSVGVRSKAEIEAML